MVMRIANTPSLNASRRALLIVGPPAGALSSWGTRSRTLAPPRLDCARSAPRDEDVGQGDWCRTRITSSDRGSLTRRRFDFQGAALEQSAAGVCHTRPRAVDDAAPQSEQRHV